MNTLELPKTSEEEAMAYASRLDRIMLNNTHESQMKDLTEQQKDIDEKLKISKAKNMKLLALLKQAGIDPDI